MNILLNNKYAFKRHQFANSIKSRSKALFAYKGQYPAKFDIKLRTATFNLRMYNLLNGQYQTRTDDVLLVRQALYQLS